MKYLLLKQININIVKLLENQRQPAPNIHYLIQNIDFFMEYIKNISRIYNSYSIFHNQMLREKFEENQNNKEHLQNVKLQIKNEEQRSNLKTESRKISRKKLSKQIYLSRKKSVQQLSFRISHRNNSINMLNNNRIHRMRNTIESIVLGQKLAEIGQNIQKTQKIKQKQNIIKYMSINGTERKTIKSGKLRTNNQLKWAQGYRKLKDYRYYISQIEQYMEKVKQQNSNIFIDHLLLALYQYKSYRYVIMPQNPQISFNVHLNQKFIQYTHSPYERTLFQTKSANGTRFSRRFKRSKQKKQENQVNKSVNLSANKDDSKKNCHNLTFTHTNPNKSIKLNRNILLFDLDQTLIHTFTKLDQYSHPSQHIYEQNDSQHCKLEQFEIFITKHQPKPEKMNKNQQDPSHFQEFQQKISKISISSLLRNRNCVKSQRIVGYIRPHAKQMLRRLSDHFIVGIFTAAQQTYANQILKILDPQSKIFSIKLYRQHCLNLSTLSYMSANNTSSTHSQNVKDLRILAHDGYRIPASNLILVDNSPLSYLFQPDNGVPIIPFTTNPFDNQLLRLERFLYENLRKCGDVRDVISSWFGTKYYQNFKSIREIVDQIFNKVEKIPIKNQF